MKSKFAVAQLVRFECSYMEKYWRLLGCLISYSLFIAVLLGRIKIKFQDSQYPEICSGKKLFSGKQWTLFDDFLQFSRLTGTRAQRFYNFIKK